MHSTLLENTLLAANSAPPSDMPGAALTADARKRRDLPNVYIWTIALLALALSLVYAVRIPPGAPADEPAHFLNVKYYAHHARLPVLGDKEVGYEGQMGPVYYVVAGALYRILSPISEKTAFYALRIGGSLLVVPMTLLGGRLARRALRGRSDAILASVILLALSPSLLAIASSVQNDFVTIVLCMWATAMAAEWIGESTLENHHAAMLGLLVSLAILTKATALFLVGPIPLYAWLVHRNKSFRFCGIFLGVIALLTGWWFARNIALYGDLTAQKGLTLYHYGNNPPPLPLWHAAALKHWLWGIQSYYWGPTEYYRSIFSASLAYRAMVGVFTLLAVAGWIRCAMEARSHADTAPANTRWFRWFLASEYVGCLALFTYTTLRVTNFAARCTFPTYFIFAMLVGAGGLHLFSRYRLAGRLYIAALAVSLLAMNCQMLIKVGSLADQPFMIKW